MYHLYDSTRADKKFMIVTPSGHKVHFGATGYEDFTIHKDEERKQRYISRHQHNEDWNISGINTAGFWSRWVLWNKPTIKQSINDITNQFNVDIEYDIRHD